MKAAFDQTAPDAPPGATMFRAALAGDAAEIKRLIAEGAAVEARNGFDHTPLMLAASRGHLAAVEALLDAGADINAVTKNQYTAVGMTASLPEADVTELLLARGADPFLGQAEIRKNLLRAAVGRGEDNLFTTLVDAGTDFRYADEGGRNLLMLACDSGQPGMLRRLIEAGLDPLEKDKAGNTAARRAAEKGSDACLEILLNGHPEILKAEESLLNIVAKKGAEKAVEFLLGRGADPNHGHDNSSAPLRNAINSKNVKCVELLLQHGADPMSEAWDGDAKITDEECAKKAGGEIEKLVTAAARKYHLPLAAKTGDTALMKTLLDEGIPAETTDWQGCTALLNAIDQCQVEAVRLLLEYKADVNYATKYGRTPLLDAVKKFDWDSAERNPVLVELLLEAGANPDTLHYKSKKTALATAVNQNETAMVASLLAHKADPNLASGDDERTPLFAAIEKKSPELVAQLIDGGARVNLKDKAGFALTALADECGNAEIRNLVKAQYGQEMDELAEDATRLNDHVTPLKALKYRHASSKPFNPRH